MIDSRILGAWELPISGSLGAAPAFLSSRCGPRRCIARGWELPLPRSGPPLLACRCVPAQMKSAEQNRLSCTTIMRTIMLLFCRAQISTPRICVHDFGDAFYDMLVMQSPVCRAQCSFVAHGALDTLISISAWAACSCCCFLLPHNLHSSYSHDYSQSVASMCATPGCPD